MEKVETHPAGGLLLVLSAPTGGGKTTIARRLVDGNPRLRFSVSHTTRKRRPGEQDGVDYHFVSEADFASMTEQGEFLERARVHGYAYGTHRSERDRAFERGEVLILDVDVQGGLQVKKAEPGAILVFILPPNFEVLLDRLGKRKAEPGFDLATRLASALRELEFASVYDYTIVNEDLGVAVDQVRRILDTAGLRSPGGLERVSQLSQDITRWLRSHDVHRP
jgi:guanylate kinase